MHFLINGAVDGTRTRDPQLGKLMLYQLSYYRIVVCWYVLMLLRFRQFIVPSECSLHCRGALRCV